MTTHGFTVEEFAHLANILASSDDDHAITAYLSNNLNVIIAALRVAGKITPEPNETYTIAKNVGDRAFLRWMAQRLVNVYNESPNTDFVQTLNEFADRFVPAEETFEKQELLDRITNLEELRPEWAQGYSSDSIAAQTSFAALHELWKILGAKNQTEAVKILGSVKDQLGEPTK